MVLLARSIIKTQQTAEKPSQNQTKIKIYINIYDKGLRMGSVFIYLFFICFYVIVFNIYLIKVNLNKYKNILSEQEFL